MSLLFVASHILGQLADLVNEISFEYFSRPSETLGGSSIGQHIRHTVEEIYEKVDTSVMRELAYYIEHAVHPMAMIKIALREVAPYVKVAENFGIAASTVRHRHRLHNLNHQ